MKEINITLRSISDIRNFVNAVTLLDYEVDLKQGRYLVDAKSIMGIFSLDLLSPINVVAHCDDASAFFAPSRIRMEADFISARAIEIRCFCPPDTVTPRSPRTV